MIKNKTTNWQKYGAYSSILCGRKPSASSDLYNNEGDEIGSIEFFVTPLGIAFSLLITMPEGVGGEQIFDISIDGKKEKGGEGKAHLPHRTRTAYLPSVSVKDGCGYLTYFTDLFGLCEIIGRKISLRFKNSSVASGEIVAAAY